MRKIDELMQELEGLKVEAKACVTAKDLEGAKAKKQEIEDIKALIEIEKELEQEIEVEIQNKTVNREEDVKMMNKVDEVVAFNKAVAGKTLTEAEAAVVSTGQIEETNTKGGYLVPAQEMTKIKELRRAFVSLKDECNLIPVNSNHGSFPIGVVDSAELINFDEINEITQSDIQFNQVAFKTADYGTIIPVSNTLLADEKAGIMPYISKTFVKRAVTTENKKILAIVKTATKKTGTDYKVIAKALTKDLDPAISANAVILTNQDGFEYLDSLVDGGNGRPMLTESLTDATQKLFKGRRVIVMPNSQMPTTTLNKLEFYVGSIAEMVSFFDRQQVEVARSTEAGFTKNATYVRAIERFDVKKVDADAMVFCEVTVTP